MRPSSRTAGSERTARPSHENLLIDSASRALRRARDTDLPRDLRKSLDRIEAATRSGDGRTAARHLDQAWRARPDSPALTAAYAHLLALDGRDPEAALRLLAWVAPEADHAALRVHLLSVLGRDDTARAELAAALMAYCIDPGSWLAHTAGVQLRNTAAPAWVGRGRGLDFIGEFAAEPAPALQITLDTGAAFMQPLQRLAGSPQRFRFTLSVPPHARVTIACRGVALMGSGGTAVPEFGLEAAVQATRSRVRGWVRLGWSPHAPLALKLTDDRGACVTTMARRVDRSGHGLGFDVRLAAGTFRGRALNVCAQLPSGEWTALPDMPTPFEDAVRPAVRGRRPVHWRGDAPARRATPATRRAVDIIIPVYRGHEATLACLAAVAATAPAARCVVVDDATPEPALAAALDALAAAGHIHLVRNAVNLGFVGAVNRAMAMQTAHDVVLLNADTVVFGDWLARLTAAAYDAPHVGTATPFSNSGFIASYPGPGEGALSPQAAAAVAAHVAAVLPGVHAALPFGVGFCLYLRRDCLNDVGGFAADVFGKGYGEETDFCLRARARGWAHRLAAGAFVQHTGGVSFGARRTALRARTLRLLERRHPGFQRLLADYAERDPLRPLRRRLDHARLLAHRGRCVLLVSLALPGGVERFVAERCRTLRDQGRVALVLKPYGVGDARRCVLAVDGLDTPNLDFAIPAELPALAALLRSMSLEGIEIQHFLHFDPRVIDMVRGLGPYEVVVHDYAWICPRITLIDESGRYCGEPAATVCTACVRRNGSNLGEPVSVPALRRRSVRWLTGAARVSAPSADTARRLTRYVERPIEVVPHSALPAPPTRPAGRSAAPAARATVRVALVGALGVHKGYRVLLECARDAAARALPLEFVVIGFTENDAPLTATGKVFITGRFVDGEARALLEREAPDVVFLASVWPETWSYALTDALASGVPIVAFDLGAPAERLRAAGQGVLLPMDATAQCINDEFVKRGAQSPLEPARDMDIMAEHKEKKTMSKAAAPAPPADALSASVQILPLTAGLYLFSVTTAGGAPARSGGQLQIPAMHVGLGPGVNSSQVEFVAGPSTEGAWLFALEDCLVTKVHGAGATLVLTSVRGPGGETLSIKVQRLDTLALAGHAAVNAVADAPAAAPARGRNGHAPALAGGASATDESLPLPVAIGAHIRTRGDMLFSDVPWAGRIATGLWIESFLVRPLERFQPGDIEYKGLTGSGFETPWLSDGIMCGTKGMAVPLVGFAIRLKASRETAAYDCEYSGYFKSGVTVGPLKNGTPCRSTVANDPLEGIQVHIKTRRAENAARPKPKAPAMKSPPAAGPSFGRYRDAAPVGVPRPAAGPRTKPPLPRIARKRPAKR